MPGSARTSATAAAISSGSSGAKYRAASPHTSGSDAADRAGDRAAAGHRLERRQPEALVQRGEDDRGRALVELDQLLQPDIPEHVDAVGVLARMPATRELELQLGPVLAQQREGLEEPGVILVRPRARRVEQKLLARLVARLEELVIDAVVDHPDPVPVEAEGLLRAVADEGARHDHELRRASRAVVGDPPELALAAGEELWQVEMLDVVQRHRGRRLYRWDADRQRVVHGVDAGEPPDERPRPGGRPRHGRQSPGNRAGCPVLLGHLRREPLTRVGRDGRQVDAVGERPSTREGAQELAGCRFAASELTGDERQEGDSDHAAAGGLGLGARRMLGCGCGVEQRPPLGRVRVVVPLGRAPDEVEDDPDERPDERRGDQDDPVDRGEAEHHPPNRRAGGYCAVEVVLDVVVVVVPVVVVFAAGGVQLTPLPDFSTRQVWVISLSPVLPRV